MWGKRTGGGAASYTTRLPLLFLSAAGTGHILTYNHRLFDILTMRFAAACMALGLISSTFAHPVDKRADALPPVDSTTDESVLQLALYLEHLETALYTGGYENFTDAQYTAAGFPPGFRDNVGVIAQVR